MGTRTHSGIDALSPGAPAAPVADEAIVNSTPNVLALVKSHRSFNGDVRSIPQTLKGKIRPERPEHEAPDADQALPGDSAPIGSGLAPQAPNAPAPSASSSFDGIHYSESCNGGQCGDGHPPDTNGDVGPTYYIQTVNTAIGIYNKSTGARVAGFTFNNFMSQGNFGNLCDTDNYGDPVVVYDSFTDRWIITDFAFIVNSNGSVAAPAYQCFAVSKTGDPVAGGWNYYSITISDALNDYPKFGVWPDGLYMSANMFGFGANGAFKNVRAWVFNKTQMYDGAPTVQAVSFDVAKVAGTSPFTLLPSNARAQTGTPPVGTPNYYAGVYGVTNKLRIHKFHVDWSNTANSTFTGPFDSTTSTSWSTLSSSYEVPELNGNTLDTLTYRLMVQNQYTNIGGVESLWDSHTVAGSSNTQAVPRWYQVKVSGGTIEANATQAATWNPDSKNRWMPSLAVDRAGNMAIGYSVSDATIYPAIRYAGRLSTDPVNTLGQTETSLIEGAGSQTNLFSDGTVDHRWGDYSAMTLDPDGCTFWYTTEYYASYFPNNGSPGSGNGDDHTRIGSFRFSQCTPLANGALEGSVRKSSDNTPISGATVSIGNDTATTDANGSYTFANYPVGTYTVSAVAPGYGTSTANNVVIGQNSTTTQNFLLTAAPASACVTDTTQADFQGGAATSLDLASSPGNVKLASVPGAESLDQQQTTASGSAFNNTYMAQTFTAGLTGTLSKADLYVQGGGTLTIEIRTTSGGTPTTTVLGSTTISSPTSVAYTSAINFNSAVNVTAGTVYALVISNNTGSGLWVICSPGGNNCSGNYSGGNAFTSTTGSAWSTTVKDFVFKTYVSSASTYANSGSFVSSLKDANPTVNAVANWTTLSWTNAALPSGTSLQFQVAGSNSFTGPFNFVGPNGTAGTFFNTSGASLSQFNGLRYLKYKAYLSTTDTASTPTLNDVTVCYNNATLTPTGMAVSSATGTYGDTTNLSATLSAGGNGVSGKSVNFTLNGSPVGNATTNGSGTASLSNVSLSGINAGTYPTGVAASFAGDSTFANSGGNNSLTVNKADQAISVSTHAPASAVYNSQFTVAATADSTLDVSYTSSGACTNAGPVFTMSSGTGTCTVKYDQAGDDNYNAATEVMEAVTAAKAGQTITFDPLSDKTYGDPDFNVTASASSGLGITFAAAGVCTVSGNTVHITGTGSCTITASQAGDSNYAAATPVDRSFTVNGVPRIAVEQPPGSDLVSGTSTVDFGGVAPNGTNSRTFTIRNDGSADLTNFNITLDGTNQGDFSITAEPGTSVAPGGTTSFTVQFAPGATGARSAGCHIASNDPNTSSFNIALTATGYTYSESWRLHYFGDINNSGDGADTNDFEHDGLPNLMEFATGSDPTQPNGAPGLIEYNGNNLEFSYTRAVAALSDGIIFDVEWSDDLTAWSAVGVTESILSDDGALQLVKATVPLEGVAFRIVRLKVTRP